MERFFIVKNENLIELLKEYESMRRKVDEVFGAFKKEVGIETVKYYQSTDVLKIVPIIPTFLPAASIISLII